MIEIAQASRKGGVVNHDADGSRLDLGIRRNRRTDFARIRRRRRRLIASVHTVATSGSADAKDAEPIGG
jgi:hypothetical protein